MPSMLISGTEFVTLPIEVQSLLLARFSMPTPKTETAIQAVAPEAVEVEGDDEGEGAELTTALAKKIIEGSGEKTRRVLRELATYSVEGFELPTLESFMGVGTNGLRGVWAGLTKITRRVLSDDEAFLIAWSTTPSDEWFGRLSPAAHRAFRKAFGM